MELYLSGGGGVGVLQNPENPPGNGLDGASILTVAVGSTTAEG